MTVTNELESTEEEAVLVHGELLYEVSPDGLKKTANSLVRSQSPGQEKNQKHPKKRQAIISKL